MPKTNLVCKHIKNFVQSVTVICRCYSNSGNARLKMGNFDLIVSHMAWVLKCLWSRYICAKFLLLYFLPSKMYVFQLCINLIFSLIYVPFTNRLIYLNMIPLNIQVNSLRYILDQYLKLYKIEKCGTLNLSELIKRKHI